MKTIRVLMVVRLFHPWIGGAERQAHQLAKKLTEKGIDVQVVTGWWFRGTPKFESVDGIPVFRNHTMWHMFDIRGLRKLGGFLYIATLWWHLWKRQGDYDIIHVHSLSYHTFAAVLAGRWLKRKTVTKLANSGTASDIRKMCRNQQLPLTRYMLPMALKSDRFVATNPTIAAELRGAGVPSERVLHLTNGVETTTISPKSNYFAHRPVRLVFVGRLHEQKGVDVLLHAFQRLVRRFPADDLHLDVVGDGPLREDLQALTQELGIQDRVAFVGSTDRVSRYMSRADIFVLPSRAEGISNALLEAMAHGLPVVASRIPGNVDVVEHQRSGLLCTVNDPGSLARNLMPLLTFPDLRERLGKAARLSVQERFSLNHIADRYVNIYQELLPVNP